MFDRLVHLTESLLPDIILFIFNDNFSESNCTQKTKFFTKLTKIVTINFLITFLLQIRVNIISRIGFNKLKPLIKDLRGL